MENEREFSVEEMIGSIIDRHRDTAFKTVEEEMYKAYDEVAELTAVTGLRHINLRKISGISMKTIKEIRNRKINGEDIIPSCADARREYFIEFIKARTLTFEAQRARYSNFLKPWTEEDDRMLELLWCEGRRTEELAAVFKRHPKGINARIARLELEEKYG